MGSLRKDTPLEESHELSNGYHVLVRDNGVGGRSYYSDEAGNGVLIWDTSLVSE